VFKIWRRAKSIEVVRGFSGLDFLPSPAEYILVRNEAVKL
jgi:hypothetical protein